MKYFYFFLSFLLLAVCLPQIARAEGVGLAISPPLIQIVANPPSAIQTPVTIENLTKKEANIQIAFQSIKASSKADGTVVPDRSMRSFPSFVSVRDSNKNKLSEITLAPYEKKTLFLSVDLSTPLKKDYYFSMLFIQKSIKDNQDHENTHTTLQAGVGLNVLLTAGQRYAPDITIEDFSTNFLIQQGPVPFIVKIANNGRQLMNVESKIDIATIFNQPIAAIPLRTSPILSGSSRKFMPAVWDQTVLFGIYKATLHISFPPDTKSYTRSIYFISFPFLLTGGLFFLVVEILVIKLKLKEK